MSTSNLYPGEHLETIASFPTLYNYLPAGGPSDNNNNNNNNNDNSSSIKDELVVFIPGMAHLARIAYGGHAGHNPKDFLAYWLNSLGYNVLAISYPLEMPEISSSPFAALAQCPGFRMVDWAEQVAQTTRKVIDENKLQSNRVIILAWSMAGKILKPFTLAAKRSGLDMRLFLSLAATPAGINGLFPVPSKVRRTEAGYDVGSPLAVELFVRQFLAQCHQEENDGGDDDDDDDYVRAPSTSNPVTDEEAYRREYIGHTPVNLINTNLAYCEPTENPTGESGLFISSTKQDGLNVDTDPTGQEFNLYPYVAAIRPTSPVDPRHVLTDSAAWGLVLTMKLTADIMGVGGFQVTPENEVWDQVHELVTLAPSKLTNEAIRGNHFFFLGKLGARQTAEAIDRLSGRAEGVRRELGVLLGRLRI